MTLDPIILSRLQFGWVIAWHILLPAFTVGIASYIALLEGLFFFTGKEIYFRISSFWIRIFAIAFGMGVVTGVVMPFQFGTNWSRFSDITANIVSPLLAYEGLTAFTLEAGFLGVLLFGRKLVPQWMHFGSALLVAFGTLFSSFWILSTNSWMQTPAGYRMVDGRFVPVDWMAIVFNPSFPYPPGPYRGRFLCHHRLCGAGGGRVADPQEKFCRRGQGHADHDADLAGGAGAAAGPAGRHARVEHARIPARQAGGDRSALEPEARTPLTLFAIPDTGRRANRRRNRRAAAGQPDPDP